MRGYVNWCEFLIMWLLFVLAGIGTGWLVGWLTR